MQKPLWTKSGKALKIVGMANDECQEQKKRSLKRHGGKDSSFCSVDGHMPPQELGAGTGIPNIERDMLYSGVTL